MMRSSVFNTICVRDWIEPQLQHQGYSPQAVFITIDRLLTVSYLRRYSSSKRYSKVFILEPRFRSSNPKTCAHSRCWAFLKSVGVRVYLSERPEHLEIQQVAGNCSEGDKCTRRLFDEPGRMLAGQQDYACRPAHCAGNVIVVPSLLVWGIMSLRITLV